MYTGRLIAKELNTERDISNVIAYEYVTDGPLKGGGGSQLLRGADTSVT